MVKNLQQVYKMKILIQSACHNDHRGTAQSSLTGSPGGGNNPSSSRSSRCSNCRLCCCSSRRSRSAHLPQMYNSNDTMRQSTTSNYRLDELSLRGASRTAQRRTCLQGQDNYHDRAPRCGGHGPTVTGFSSGWSGSGMLDTLYIPVRGLHRCRELQRHAYFG